MKTDETPQNDIDTGAPLVDKTLVAMFLKLSPEERLKANDDAVQTILELRNGFRRSALKDPDLLLKHFAEQLMEKDLLTE